MADRRRPLAAGLAAMALAGCASRTPDAPPPQPGDKPTMGQAVTTPLSDLNVVRAEIPPVLLDAKRAPYALPADRSCTALAAEVATLDAVLGTDLDTPPTPNNPGLVERGSDVAGEAATSAVQSAMGGLIPFRGWVRKLTGAERYAREVSAAIAAGAVRRAFLKGLGESAGCAAPAAPRR